MNIVTVSRNSGSPFGSELLLEHRTFSGYILLVVMSGIQHRDEMPAKLPEELKRRLSRSP